MKANEFQRKLEPIIGLISEHEDRALMAALLDALAAHGDKSIATVLRLATQEAGPADKDESERGAQLFRRVINGLSEIASKSLLTDMNRILIAFESDAITVASLGVQSAMDIVPNQDDALQAEAAIARYAIKLEEALGHSEQFEQVFGKLTADKTLKAAHVKRLSKKFAGAAGKTKRQSLAFIRSRHLNMERLQAENTGRMDREAA